MPSTRRRVPPDSREETGRPRCATPSPDPVARGGPSRCRRSRGPAACARRLVREASREVPPVDSPPFSHDFALQRLDAPGLPGVGHDRRGRGRPRLRVRRRTRILEVARVCPQERHGLTRSSRSTSSGRTLSDQPIGRDRRDPPRPRFLLWTSTSISASAGNDATSVLETLVPLGQPLSRLALGPRRHGLHVRPDNLATRRSIS